MVQKKTFAIIGGDLRQAHLANILASKEKGYKIYGMFLENEVKLSLKIHCSNDIQLALPQSDVVIFPLPLLDVDGNINTPLSKQRIRLEDCLDYISPEALVLAGKIPQEAKNSFHNKDIEFVDYLEREEFAVLNAIPTAEGAVEIALRELPITLSGASCLVTGFGRISKVLVQRLQAFGAQVRVVARKCGDLAWIKAYGCEAVHISRMAEYLPNIDVLFNTVPAVILGEDKLKKLNRDCLVIDLASKPGGVDFETAKNLGLKTIWALSLPGKVAPITAGEITLNTIFNILSEKGGL